MDLLKKIFDRASEPLKKHKAKRRSFYNPIIPNHAFEQLFEEHEEGALSEEILQAESRPVSLRSFLETVAEGIENPVSANGYMTLPSFDFEVTDDHINSAQIKSKQAPSNHTMAPTPTLRNAVIVPIKHTQKTEDPAQTTAVSQPIELGDNFETSAAFGAVKKSVDGCETSSHPAVDNEDRKLSRREPMTGGDLDYIRQKLGLNPFVLTKAPLTDASWGPRLLDEAEYAALQAAEAKKYQPMKEMTTAQAQLSVETTKNIRINAMSSPARQEAVAGMKLASDSRLEDVLDGKTESTKPKDVNSSALVADGHPNEEEDETSCGVELAGSESAPRFIKAESSTRKDAGGKSNERSIHDIAAAEKAKSAADNEVEFDPFGMNHTQVEIARSHEMLQMSISKSQVISAIEQIEAKERVESRVADMFCKLDEINTNIRQKKEEEKEEAQKSEGSMNSKFVVDFDINDPEAMKQHQQNLLVREGIAASEVPKRLVSDKVITYKRGAMSGKSLAVWDDALIKDELAAEEATKVAASKVNYGKMLAKALEENDNDYQSIKTAKAYLSSWTPKQSASLAESVPPAPPTFQIVKTSVKDKMAPEETNIYTYDLLKDFKARLVKPGNDAVFTNYKRNWLLKEIAAVAESLDLYSVHMEYMRLTAQMFKDEPQNLTEEMNELVHSRLAEYNQDERDNKKRFAFLEDKYKNLLKAEHEAKLRIMKCEGGIEGDLKIEDESNIQNEIKDEDEVEEALSKKS